MSFEEWLDSFEDFETYVGVNGFNHREMSRQAWNHQQQKIDELKKSISLYKDKDLISVGSRTKAEWRGCSIYWEKQANVYMLHLDTLQKENEIMKDALREIIEVEGDSQVSCFAEYTLAKLKEEKC
jgi:hypothetical protein